MLVLHQLLFIASLAFTVKVSALKASNLYDSKQLIKSAEGIKAFEDQIEGKTVKSVPKNLPAGITLDELSQLVFNKSYNQLIKNKNDRTSINVQLWPGRPSLYIGVGQIEGALECAHIFITVFKITKPHTFEIISRPEKPFTFTIENLGKIEDFEQGDALHELVRIDGARFQIAPTEFAFGLRLAHNEGYAGGFGQFHNLILFTLKDKSIVPILNIPIYSLQDLAGDWNEDGTREHYVIENEWVVCFADKKHNGYFDLQIKQKKSTNKSYRLVWSNGKYTLPSTSAQGIS